MPAIRRSRTKAMEFRRRRSADTILERVTTVAARPVLVATDGSRPSSAAIKLTRIMSRDGLWAPSVITATLPLPVAVGDMILPMPPLGYETVANDNLLASMAQQIKRYGDPVWPLSLEFGRPAPAILEAARRRGSGLIVLGLGKHGHIGRLFGAETAAHVARHAAVPVLAVHQRLWTRPSIAVVGVDFGDASLRAAREALALLQPPGRLHLVHVKLGYNTTAFADSAWETAYAAGAAKEFELFRDELGDHPRIEISSVVVNGNVAEKMVDEAEVVRAELIALGSHNENVLERVMIGSTPTDVLRLANCSVLIAPPAYAVP